MSRRPESEERAGGGRGPEERGSRRRAGVASRSRPPTPAPFWSPEDFQRQLEAQQAETLRLKKEAPRDSAPLATGKRDLRPPASLGCTAPRRVDLLCYLLLRLDSTYAYRPPASLLIYYLRIRH